MDRLIEIKHDGHKLKSHNLSVSLRKEKETVHYVWFGGYNSFWNWHMASRSVDTWAEMFGHESKLVLCSQEVDATVVGLFANLFSVTSLVLYMTQDGKI